MTISHLPCLHTGVSPLDTPHTDHAVSINGLIHFSITHIIHLTHCLWGLTHMDQKHRAEETRYLLRFLMYLLLDDLNNYCGGASDASVLLFSTYPHWFLIFIHVSSVFLVLFGSSYYISSYHSDVGIYYYLQSYVSFLVKYCCNTSFPRYDFACLSRPNNKFTT